MSIKEDFERNRGSKHSFSDDSDLASLAREFEEEELVKESPFIRKVIDTSYINIYTINEFRITYITKTYKYNLVLLNFILLSNKKNDRIKKQSSESMLGTPLPEDAEVPFISSLQGTKARSMSLHNKSSALESFMKFDKKYTRVSSFESDEYTLVSILSKMALDYIFCVIIILLHFSKDAIQNKKKMT